MKYLSIILLILISLNAKCVTWESGRYTNNIDVNHSISIDDTDKIQVCIRGETERGKDFITLFDSDGKLIKKLSGNIDRSFILNDNSIIVNLKSDSSVTKSGINVSIDKIFDNFCINCANSFETGEYENNSFIRKTLLIPDATKIRVSIQGESEKNLDFLKIYDFNYKLVKRISGEINTTFEIDSPSIIVEFNSDNSVTKHGIDVKIEKIETNSSVANFSIGALNKRGIYNYNSNAYIQKTLLLPNANSAELIIEGNTELNYDVLNVKISNQQKRYSGEISEKLIIDKKESRKLFQSTRANFSNKTDYNGIRLDLTFKTDETNSNGGFDIKLKKIN